MKKIFVLSIVLLLALTCSLPVFAAENAETNEAPNFGEIMPGGALAPGETTTPLTDEERQLRETAYNEILELAKTDKNILGVKIQSDIILVGIADDDSPEKMKEYARKFIEQYGSFVVVTNDIDAALSAEEAGGLDGGTGKNNNPFENLWLWSVALLVLIGTASFFFMRTRRVSALQTANGNVITQSTVVNSKETVSAIKKSETAPGENVFNSILQKIDKKDL